MVIVYSWKATVSICKLRVLLSEKGYALFFTWHFAFGVAQHVQEIWKAILSLIHWQIFNRTAGAESVGGLGTELKCQ